MSKPVRRVVTGHRRDGCSTVLADGPADRAARDHESLLRDFGIDAEEPEEICG
jgi:hypothetical protein